MATRRSSDLLSLVSAVTGSEPPCYDYIRINDFGPEVLPREWRGLVTQRQSVHMRTLSGGKVAPIGS
jgi:hypothetical protein